MKFVLACYGTRGDVEPSIVVGRELLQRGHEVRIAVPPNLVSLAEEAGLAAVPYGLDSHACMEAQFEYWTCLIRNPWKLAELNRMGLDNAEFATRCWAEMTTTLISLAEGADLLIAGLIFEQPAVNVAEYLGIPLATVHFFPMRPRGGLLPYLPPLANRAAMAGNEWLTWRLTRRAEDAQRRALGLPEATGPASRRVRDRAALEVQAYDEVCFPGLAAEWSKWNALQPPRRPFVGALTLQLATDTDAEVAAWIAEGKPPIFFGFGSIPVESPAEILAMIDAACAELGQRALVGAAVTDFSRVPHSDHVKVVGTMNYATIFPACRALVHHGGTGTTNAGLRAGVPTLILWTLPDQPLNGVAIKRLKVGTARRLSSTTEKSLLADLRTILAPDYAARARQLATQMTDPAASASAAADRLEDFARHGRVSV